MKLILHIPNFYPPHLGGIEDVCYNIVSHLSSLPDIEQRVLCFNGSRSSKTDDYEGVKVVRIGDWGMIARQSIAPRYYDRLRREIRRFRPDFIHFHAPNPLAAACLLASLPTGVKLIVHWHSDIIAQKNIYRLIKPVETALLRRADTIVATSPHYIDGSEQLHIFKEKCVVIPNVVNVAKLAPDKAHVDEIRKRYDNKPLLLFVGRHVPYKGLDRLLSAVSMLRSDCRVVVGGTGPLTKHLKRDYPSEKVHFLGKIPNEELAAYYHAADLFLFTSITKNEAFGVALAEAMYCGAPAVTFTIPGSGVNWVNINGETGIEVENGNDNKLADAIDHLITHEDLRREYGRNAHRRVADHMTPEKITHLIDALYM